MEDGVVRDDSSVERPISVEPGPVRRAYGGRRILLTGLTGFLGKVFLALLLEQVPEIGRIYVLIRRRARKEPAVRRFERAVETSPVFRGLRRRHGDELGAWLSARVEVIDGDVEKPGCDLPPEAMARLAGRVDLVVHCAGLTDFQPDPQAAIAVNVAGAMHVAELASRTGARMMHVSTAFVAGSIGKGEVPEELRAGIAPSGSSFSPAAELRSVQLALRAAGDDTRARIDVAMARAKALGWPNIYTYTKGLAEHLVGARTGVTIVRPSIVECARTFPFAGWNEGLNTAGPLAWLITTPYRRLPTRPDHRFDVIPVDDAARGMILVGREILEGRGGGVFHLASSDVNPLLFGRCVELTGLGFRKWTRQGNGTAWERSVIRHLDPVPAPDDADRGLGRWADWLAAAHELVDKAQTTSLGSRFGSRLSEWGRRLSAGESDLASVEKMLDLYAPFIRDNDYIFRTDRVRALASVDPTLRWEVGEIDWCSYWVDVEYPGLRKWCIPLLYGERVPSDPAAPVAFRMAASAAVPA
jgi:long-chain acyl-CoA synthetase